MQKSKTERKAKYEYVGKPFKGYAIEDLDGGSIPSLLSWGYIKKIETTEEKEIEISK